MKDGYNGYTSNGTWDDTLNLLSKKDFNNIYTQYSYDETGNIKYEKRMEYYPSGGPVKETRREFKGPCNGITKLVNPKGNITTWDYDNNGNLRFTHEPLGKNTQYNYFINGDLKEIIDANNNKAQYDYDNNGNLNKITIINPQGFNIVTEYLNDSFGKRIQKTDPLGRVTTQTWNAVDKVTNITFYDGTQINRTYDIRGRLTQEVDSSGHITDYTHDDNTDRMKSMTRYTDYYENGSPIISSAIITTYDYDLKGNLTCINKYKGTTTSVPLQTIQYQYDWLSRVVAKTEPDQQQGTTKTTVYTYSLAHNSPATIINKNGDGVLNKYDYFGRLITSQNIKGDGSEIERFEYDANDNMVSAEGPYGKTSYTYDDLDRLANATYQYKNCPQVFIGYAYDLTGNRISMGKYIGSFQQQSGISYSYDFANRLKTATHSMFGSVSYTYDDVGNRRTMTYPNGLAQITYDYNSKNRITNTTYKDKNGAAISSVNYDYYNNGDRKKMTNEFGITTYEYDGLDQITKVTTPRWETQEYTYDDLGNRRNLRTNEQGDIKSVSYTYDPANELRTIATEGVPGYISLDYDANGNCVKKGNINYEWDYLDRLVIINNLSLNSVIEFTYDQQNRRIKKKDSEEERYYFYDGPEPIFELNGSGNVITERFKIGNELISSVRDQVSNVKQVIYNLNDNFGSTIFVLDSSGNLLANYYYEPFGKCWNAKGDVRNDIRFIGKEYEEDIGLYYFVMRWYDPDIGRFVSPDPRSSLLNYIYCENNPLKFIDYFGLQQTNIGSPPVGSEGTPIGYNPAPSKKDTPNDQGYNWYMNHMAEQQGIKPPPKYGEGIESKDTVQGEAILTEKVSSIEGTVEVSLKTSPDATTKTDNGSSNKKDDTGKGNKGESGAKDGEKKSWWEIILNTLFGI